MGGWASGLECAPGVEEFANERHEEQQHPRHVPEPKQVALVVGRHEMMPPLLSVLRRVVDTDNAMHVQERRRRVPQHVEHEHQHLHREAFQKISSFDEKTMYSRSPQTLRS